MHIDHHIGILKTHARTLVFAITVLEPVDNGILDAVGDKARVGELVAIGHGVDTEGLAEG